MNADIGVIGLGVMGRNLILNLNDHGYRVVANNRTRASVEHFLANEAKNTEITGAYTLADLCQSLATPRKILLMVPAGDPVDALIAQLLPLLDEGDILIDGGNSHYLDTNRRVTALRKVGIYFIGAGISGGEEGARNGPSMMPGGAHEAWESVKPLFQAISAKTTEGDPCCDWVGHDGAGHFVKMVHNGIEYADMQLIAEAYHFMKVGLELSYEQMHDVFKEWNQTELHSYLIEITAEILGAKESDNTPIIENILDTAGQKGTGKWTGINALELGVPLTVITEAVYARHLSSLKSARIEAETKFGQRNTHVEGNTQDWLDALRGAILAARIISYAQGFMLMQNASDEYGWALRTGDVALMWREGCIIRSAFLNDIHDAFTTDPDLSFLGLAPYFHRLLKQYLPAWRKVAAKSIEKGIPMPCTTTALTFIDAYTSSRLPANLLQAQRDYFGAHTYERIDQPRGMFFHTEWSKN